MTLSTGARISSFEILATLGAGGMGEVYRAKDTKLGRDVALKLLPASFTNDPERVARFRREAQVLASLNHPHIAQIHGMEEANGTQFLVLELVDGESLDKRIARGKIPLDEALGIAKQIAEALEAAHEKGIIHRDLKPANIALTKDGQVKVLDFGLAKAVDTTSSIDAMNSPTVTSPAMMTGVGVILGTAAYMSPEQARGQPVDRRSDVWAFGCVLFEMLTGTRAFLGENVTDVIANIVRGMPSWNALPGTAAPVVGILQQCLEKDPRRRFHSVADVTLLLEDAASEEPTGTAGVQASVRVWWSALGLLGGLVIGGAAVSYFARAPSAGAPPSLARFELPATKDLLVAADLRGTNVAIAPDGSRVVYTAKGGGSPQLAVRSLDQLDVRPVAGTEGGQQPFFSFDGRSLGFATFLELKRVPAAGGSASTICKIDAIFSGASWGANDVIVFTQGSLGLLQVPAAGGQPVTIAKPDSANGEVAFSAPLLLPDAQSVLYTVRLQDGTRRIDARRLDQNRATTIVEDAFGPQYQASGYLVFGRGDRLMAARFDAATLRVSSEPVPVPAGNILMNRAQGVMNVAITADGTMAYVSGREISEMSRLVWIDRAGNHAVAVTQLLQAPGQPRVSPDGHRVVVVAGPRGQGQLWVLDLSGKAQALKLTYRDHSLFPIWSPDGKRIAFMMRTSTDSGTRVIPADGSAVEPDTLLTGFIGPPIAWSPNGTSMLLERGQPSKIMLLNFATHDVQPWLRTPFEESGGRLSPNGAWLAYASNQSGASEVWVRPFPGPGVPMRVSSEGGVKPMWSRDGSEIFYESGAKMMAAGLRVSASSLEVEPPKMLFEGGFKHDDIDPHIRYVDVGSDNRFLSVEPLEAESAASLVLVQHWSEELKRLVPTK